MLLLKWLWVKWFSLSWCSENVLVGHSGKSTRLRRAEHAHPRSISLPNEIHVHWSPVDICLQRSGQADAWWPGQIQASSDWKLTSPPKKVSQGAGAPRAHRTELTPLWPAPTQHQGQVCTPLHTDICASCSASLSELHSPKSHSLNPHFFSCSNKLLASTNDKDLAAGYNSLCKHY